MSGKYEGSGQVVDVRNVPFDLAKILQAVAALRSLINDYYYPSDTPDNQNNFWTPIHNELSYILNDYAGEVSGTIVGTNEFRHERIANALLNTKDLWLESDVGLINSLAEEAVVAADSPPSNAGAFETVYTHPSPSGKYVDVYYKTFDRLEMLKTLATAKNLILSTYLDTADRYKENASIWNPLVSAIDSILAINNVSAKVLQPSDSLHETIADALMNASAKMWKDSDISILQAMADVAVKAASSTPVVAPTLYPSSYFNPTPTTTVVAPIPVVGIPRAPIPIPIPTKGVTTPIVYIPPAPEPTKDTKPSDLVTTTTKTVQNFLETNKKFIPYAVAGVLILGYLRFKKG